jgi:predicted ATP-grasp superfamily ATP-dependent carboligase
MDAAAERVLLLSSRSADERKVLAAVRALGMAGVQVTLASNDAGCMSLHSRFCRSFLEYPCEESDAAALADFVDRALRRHPCDALLPMCDYTTQAVVADQDRFARLSGVCVPDAQSMARATDKATLIELAHHLGIGVPKTVCIEDETMLEEAAASLGYPCVLKLRRGAGGVGRSFPESARQLRRAFRLLDKHVDQVFDSTRPLLQEFIPGEVHDACVLFNRGEPRAVLTQRRLAMMPPEGGVGIHNETTDDPELKEEACRLMRALNWHGPAQVEFKRDARDGSLRLMEVNPRFWGTLAVAVAAGVNFPLLTAAIAMRGDVEPVTDYRKGVRYRWLFNYASPQRPSDHFQLRALTDAVIRQGKHFSDFWLSDPLPHLTLLKQRLGH